MSRRTRRNQSSSKKTKLSASAQTWVFRGVIFLLLLSAVVAVGGYVWLRQYLSSSSFREVIVEKAEERLHATTTLSPLRWDGFRVHTDSFEANGPSVTKRISLEGVKTGIEAGGVTRGIWLVSPSRVTNLSLTLDTTAPPVPVIVQAPTAEVKAPWYDSLLPKKFETNSLIINDSNIDVILKSGEAKLSGTRWEVSPTDTFTQCKITGIGGKIELPFTWAPPMKLEQMRITYQSGVVFLTDSTFRIYENGHLTLGGECDWANGSYSLEGTMRDVLCKEVLPEDWRQRLTGKVESSFAIHSTSTSSSPTIKGHLDIKQGVLTALPVLDKLAAYSQSLRFRTLMLHDAEADFVCENDRITLTNVKIGSEGLARMEGKIVFTKNTQADDYLLNGDFRVGLAPGTLAQIPGAEEDVFVVGERGLMWAPMKLSGTTSDPKEDLSDRLMAAAGARMFEIIPQTGLKVLKYTQEAVTENVPSVGTIIDKSTEAVGSATDNIQKGSAAVIEGAGKTIEGVFDALGGGLLNPGKTPTPIAPPTPQKVPAPPIPPVPKTP
jgi:hypothetical protein